MTSAVASLKPTPPRVTSEENGPPARRMYRTKTSFVAVHFDQAGKGRIDFLPKDAELRVMGPSSCLRGGSEVMFEERLYNVFEIDLMARSALIFERIGTKTARHGGLRLEEHPCYRCGAPMEMHNIELPICRECWYALDAKPKAIPN